MFKILEQSYKDKMQGTANLGKREIFGELQEEFKRNNIVLIGLRQVGKTTLGEQLLLDVISSEKESNSDDKVSEISRSDSNYYYMNIKALTEGFDKLKLTNFITNNKYEYVFLDEIQEISDWSNFAQSLIDLNKNTKFIFSGSNAKSLKKETMVNRAKTFFINPLSYKEFVEFWGVKDNKFDLFIKYGSYPKFPQYSDPAIQYSEIWSEQIIDKIISQDYDGKVNTSKFKSLMSKIANYVGNDLKVQKLENSEISRPTATNYLRLMVDSGLVKMVYKYKDKSDKVYGKAYFQDKSMIYKFKAGELNNNDFGALIENIVFNYLDNKYEKKLGMPKIFVYKGKGNKEIDFAIDSIQTLIEVKFIDIENSDEHKGWEELTQDYSDRVLPEEKEWNKIIISKNYKGEHNGWKIKPLNDLLEGGVNGIL